MKIKIFINSLLYKTVDLGSVSSYEPKQLTDMVLADKAAGTIDPSFNVDQGLSIRLVKQ